MAHKKNIGQARRKVPVRGKSGKTPLKTYIK